MKSLLVLATLPLLLWGHQTQRESQSIPIRDNSDESRLGEGNYPSLTNTIGNAGLEFLYWKPIQGSSDWAIQGQTGSNQPIQPIGQIGKFERVKFSWAPGYRAFVGVQFAPNYWDLLGEYTYYHSSRKEHLKAPLGDRVLTLLADQVPVALVGTYAQLTSSSIANAYMNAHLNYNGANLSLGKTLQYDAIYLKFFMGLTGGWLKEEWRFKYVGVTTDNNKQKWKFSGGGMRIGFNMNWSLGAGFNLEGKFSIAELLGNYQQMSYSVDSNTAENGFNRGVPYATQNARYSDNRLVTNLQFFMGPSYNWGVSWLKGKLYAGYELNSWMNLHETIQAADQPIVSIDGRATLLKRGVLSFHGFTGGAAFYF